MCSPILGVPKGERLAIQVRVDEFGYPVNLPCTFVEIVETIMAASLVENRQWNYLEWFAVNQEGGQR